MKSPWRWRLLLGVLLAGGVLALRPAPSAKRVPAPQAAMTGELSARSLYRLDSSFETDLKRPLELRELRGSFQVLALIFTRCPTVCPTLVREMQALERAMPSDVHAATRFTLVSIDPAHDSPEALHAYRAKLGLSPEHWTLLRAEPDTVRELSALLGFSFASGSDAPLAHSKQVTVLNRQGEIIHQQESVGADPEKIIATILSAL